MDAHPCTAPAVQQIPTALPMCRCSVLIDTTYRSGQNRRAATKKSPKKTCVSEIENFLSQKEFVCLRCLRFRVLRKEFVCLGFRWSQKKFVCLGFRVQKKFVCLGLLAKKVCVSGISRVKKSSCVWDFVCLGFRVGFLRHLVDRGNSRRGDLRIAEGPQTDFIRPARHPFAELRVADGRGTANAVGIRGRLETGSELLHEKSLVCNA